MRKQTFLLGAIVVAFMGGGAAQPQTAAQPESKNHELACNVATTGGAVSDGPCS